MEWPQKKEPKRVPVTLQLSLREMRLLDNSLLQEIGRTTARFMENLDENTFDNSSSEDFYNSKVDQIRVIREQIKHQIESFN